MFWVIPLLLIVGVINHVVAEGAAGCDLAYVTQEDGVITVTPTGVDDTVNIQCAFDTAVAAGLDVHLTAGKFHTAQIVVVGFEGEFTGNGKYSTRIVNLPDLYVTPENMYFQPPSAENPWPTLFAFIDGNFKIADLGVSIVGAEPTTGWTIFGIDPPLKEMAGAIYVLGTEADALVENIRINGEASDGLFGYNLINGVFYEGFIGESPAAISGSFAVYDSVFRSMTSGAPIVNLSGAEVVISDNYFFHVGYAMDGGDLVDSSFTFSDNYVNATTGLDLYNLFGEAFVNSTLIIMDNKFHANETGPAIHAAFGTDVHCLFLDNKMRQVAGAGITLGEGTSNCFVVTDNTDIDDFGTDNVIIGNGNTVSHE